MRPEVAIVPRNAPPEPPRPAPPSTNLAQMNPAAPPIETGVPVAAVPKPRKPRSRKILRLPPSAYVPKNPVYGTLRYVCSNIEGGKEVLIDYLRIAASAGSEVSTAFVAKWDSLTYDEQQMCNLDDVAESMELSVPNLIGTAVAVMARNSHDASRLLVAANQPKVVESLIIGANGQGKGAAADRRTFFTASGLLPSKHGPSVAIQVNQNNSQHNDNSGNPSFEKTINATAEILQGDDK